MVEVAREHSGASFIRALIPNHLPKALPSYYYHLGVRFQHKNLRGHIDHNIVITYRKAG